MSEKRMAGSDEFKEELSRAERNKQIRTEIGNDPERLAERISGVDREKYDFTGYSDKDINMAMQGGTFDENDYARLTGQSGGDDKPVDDTPEVTDPVTPEPEETPAPSVPPGFGDDEPSPYIPAPVGGGGGGLDMSFVQDNDQNSNITGDNNVVNQNQDNSVRGYSGGGGSWKDAWMKNYFS